MAQGAVGETTEDRSLRELISDAVREITTLFRLEVDLAKAEFKQKSAIAAQGAGMFGGAALLGLLASRWRGQG